MKKKYWWSSYGPFHPWDECTSRPDPVEVLLFALDKLGIKSEQRVTYLMTLLDLHKSMVYKILKGQGLDSISRCRQLVQSLKIPPPLLGVDCQYPAYWWRASGLSFNCDIQGYPIVAEVIIFLRKQRTKIEGEKIKVWSQSDLGEATGLTKETVYKMERDKNPKILDSMTRRATLALALGALTPKNEYIFRLFGLDPQAYGAIPAIEPISIQAGHFSTSVLTDDLLKRYHHQQQIFFTDYYTYHGEHIVGEALEWVKQLQAIMPLANTTTYRVNVLALQSRYHHLLLNVAREKQKTESIIFHANKAIMLAENAVALPELGDQALQSMGNELLTSVLLARADSYYELGQYDLAQEDIDRTLGLLPTIHSNHIKSYVLFDAGLIHAYTATSTTDRKEALSYFDLAAHCIDACDPNESDDNFVRSDKGMLYIRKGMALSAPQMKRVTSEMVSDALGKAQRLTEPVLTRRQTIIDVFQAQAYIDAGEYGQATNVALLALEKSRQIRSRLNRNRIERLYNQLITTSFNDKPILARLGVKLYTWS